MGDDIRVRVVAALGEPAARELLNVLERSDADRAALIGRLHIRDDAMWLAEETRTGRLHRSRCRRPGLDCKAPGVRPAYRDQTFTPKTPAAAA